MLPSSLCIAVIFFQLQNFDIARHAFLESTVFMVYDNTKMSTTIPSVFNPVLILYYVKPYRRFYMKMFGIKEKELPKAPLSLSQTFTRSFLVLVWYIEQIPDYTLTLAYIYLFVRVRTTNDLYFSTPFFLFFFTTGVGGIASIISHIAGTRITFYPETAFLYTSLWIANHVGALGSTLGKAIIVMHRYLVFSSVEISENRSTCRRLICLQLFLPLVTAVPFLFFGFSYQTIDGHITIYSISEEGLQILKWINVSFYVVYSLFSVVLVALTGRAFIRLSRLVEVVCVCQWARNVHRPDISCAILYSSSSITLVHENRLHILNFIHFNISCG
ncbi:hypothetical protein PRIPAC_78847 [Pristionchus pacificus]|uniref:Uncharacterized protein n=1 Tax=Pristionchus pacificus TaxID=54126 RepID=A0A2A6C3Z0_PRIPA|nr:hypothetical protein PRIPAC_78847 [Pristionchus pacificus]|eukprot:PDM72850.1 hypothetical protein PRIPAC_39284 [Pristionchus pacificus]